MDSAFGWARPEEWVLSFVLPSECTPLTSMGSSFRSWLQLKAIAPLLVILLSMVGSTAVKCTQLGWSCKNLRAGIFKAMPLALFVSFIFVPSVSMNIFQEAFLGVLQMRFRPIRPANKN